MENQEIIETVEIVEEKKGFKEFVKAQGVNIALGLAGLALSGWAAYEKNKRENRKADNYCEYLDNKLEIYESSMLDTPYDRDDKPDPKEDES